MRRLCYVASPSYSGSTLLTMLLNTHPDVATVGELKGRLYDGRTPPQRCSCGRDMAACGFWRDVATRLADSGVDLDPRDLDTDLRAPGRPVVDALLRARVRGGRSEALRHVGLRIWPGAARERDRLAARNDAVIEAICAVQGGAIFVDASKDATRLAFLIAAERWDVRVLHLVRDGRGVACSARRRDGVSMRRAAWRWRRAHDAHRPLLARLGEKAVRVVHYEALAARPRETLDAVLDFLGLSAAGSSLAFSGSVHHILGNPMRFLANDDIEPDERWRRALTREDLAVFERIAGAHNRAFGYAE